jgi:hypothetical protein
MNAESSNTVGSQVFRPPLHPFVVVGVVFLFVEGLLLLIRLKTGNNYPFIMCGSLFVVMFVLAGWSRLEIRPDGFRYRTLLGTRRVAFADVSRAYFQVVGRDRHASEGMAVFRVEKKDGQRVTVNLRMFQMNAAAVLFTALERQGIEIEIPDLVAARRMADCVRAAQAEMRK